MRNACDSHVAVICRPTSGPCMVIRTTQPEVVRRRYRRLLGEEVEVAYVSGRFPAASFARTCTLRLLKARPQEWIEVPPEKVVAAAKAGIELVPLGRITGSGFYCPPI